MKTLRAFGGPALALGLVLSTVSCQTATDPSWTVTFHNDTKYDVDLFINGSQVGSIKKGDSLAETETQGTYSVEAKAWDPFPYEAVWGKQDVVFDGKVTDISL